MKNSNLIQILKTFDPKEIKEFNEYVRSPFFNKNESVILLYSYLRKCYPEFSENRVKKPVVYGKIFPGIEYSDSFMRKTMFNLQKLAEEYLINLYDRRDPVRSKVSLLFELEKRNQLKLLKKKIPEAEISAVKMQHTGQNFYRKMQDIEFIKETVLIRELTIHNKKKFRLEIQKRPVYTISSFLTDILSNYYFILNQKYTLNYDPKLEFLAEITGFIEQNTQYLEDSAISLRYYSVLLLKNMEDKYYLKLKNIFLSNLNLLQAAEKYNISRVLLNYNYLANARDGGKAHADEILDIHKIIVENKLYSLHSGMYIPSKEFLNIVMMALMNEKHLWLEEFLRKYGGELNPEVREDLLNFAAAKVFFNKKEYEKALSLIARTKKLKDTDTLLSLRNLQLMVYFELGMTESSEFAIDSYRHFLKKDTSMLESRRSLYRNFIKIYSKLLLMKINNNTLDTIKIREEIDQFEYIDEREWLIDKLDEMDKLSNK